MFGNGLLAVRDHDGILDNLFDIFFARSLSQGF